MRSKYTILRAFLLVCLVVCLGISGCSPKAEMKQENPALEIQIQAEITPEPTSSRAPEIIPEEKKPVTGTQVSGKMVIDAETESTTPITSVVATCTLSVRCDDILKNPGKLVEQKESIIPENGIILDTVSVSFSEGESVFDVLCRELKTRKIHLEFVSTPLYHSVYIEGIANLYEFDCGDTSGWMYTVNDIKPTYGCSQYKLKNGDKVEFFYQCSLYG